MIAVGKTKSHYSLTVFVSREDLNNMQIIIISLVVEQDYYEIKFRFMQKCKFLNGRIYLSKIN